MARPFEGGGDVDDERTRKRASEVLVDATGSVSPSNMLLFSSPRSACGAEMRGRAAAVPSLSLVATLVATTSVSVKERTLEVVVTLTASSSTPLKLTPAMLPPVQLLLLPALAAELRGLATTAPRSMPVFAAMAARATAVGVRGG